MALPQVPQRTTPGFTFSMIERTLYDCLGERKFGKAEIEKVLEFFDTSPPECVFCGSKDVTRWDHLIPVMKGGETVLGNIVPSCSRCDDSKRDLSFEEWMTSDTRYSPTSQETTDLDRRIERIKEYMRHFGYQPRRLKERLNEIELERLKAIRSRLLEIRNDVESLIEHFRARTR
jgi:hypothetical protein